MAENTGIQWTEKTWNPWQGCHKVSPGCKNCYMFSEKRRYGQEPNVVVRSKPPTFSAPLKWKDPALVFTCSWSDWFIEEADSWRAEAWAIIRKTPHLTYQVLTKRPERIADHLPADWGEGYPNVWLGVSVEDQQRADERIPQLLRVPARVRFLSCEPLLGPLEIKYALPWRTTEHGMLNRKPDWVIIGGESGHDARPCHLEWVRSLVEQCQGAGVAPFVKQLGAKVRWMPKHGPCGQWPEHVRFHYEARGEDSSHRIQLRDHKGGDLEEWPLDLRVREFPRLEVPAHA